jgi:hypothetical protein
MRAKLNAIKAELRKRMRDPVAETGAWAKQMLQGHLNYYAVSGNQPSIWWFFNQVRRLWLKTLRRRSQKANLSWERFIRVVDPFFPPIKTLHPLPCRRFDAKTRGRRSALGFLAGACAGRGADSNPRLYRHHSRDRPPLRRICPKTCVLMIEISKRSCSVSMSEGTGTCIGRAVFMGLVQGQVDHVSMTYPAFGNNVVGKALHVGATSLKHCNFHATLLIEMHV